MQIIGAVVTVMVANLTDWELIAWAATPAGIPTMDFVCEEPAITRYKKVCIGCKLGLLTNITPEK